MFKLFNKFKGFAILEFFLTNPNKSVGLRELAKILKLSPSTTKHYIDQFLKEDLLIDKNEKHSKQVVLNNNNEIIKEFKKIYILDKFNELNLQKIINNPFYIFGSCAFGTYNENSDLDIFIIKIRDYDISKFKSLAKEIKLEINIKEIPFYKLNEYIDRNKEFIIEVKRGVYFGEESQGL